MTGTEKQIQSLLGLRRWQEAEVLAQRNLAQDQNSADAHYLLGVSLYFQGKLGPTIKSLKEALKADPRHTDAAICLSVLLNDIGRYDEAQGVFSQANHSVAHPLSRSETVIDKKFAVKHLEIADLYFRYRRYDEAIEEYTKAASLDPTALDIRIRRAKAHSRKGFVTRAMQELEVLRNENPAFLPARIQLGLLHYSQGNHLDAELEWEAVLKLSPDHSEALAYLQMSRENQVQSP
jgi:tetratricopeptide (TPR) repeat protein